MRARGRGGWRLFAWLFAIAGGALLARSVGARRMRTRARHWLRGRRLHLYGRLQGAAYRLGGGTPSPDVPDLVLTDRIRSTLGGLEKKLDIPHLHVMVNNRVALLHGEVSTADDAAAVVAAVRRVPGVSAVHSELAVGLTPGDTRPSEGRLNQQPSPMLTAFIRAAESAMTRPEPPAKSIVGAVLTTWFERLPRRERAHVASHLPPDVRALVAPIRRRQPTDVRSPSELYTTVAARCDLHDYYTAREVTRAVLGALRDLVPEERRDIEVVLPEQLAAIWAP